jgi:hypothetical protein
MPCPEQFPAGKVTWQVLTRIASPLDSVVELWQFAVMDADEREIYQFLKSWGGEYIAPREICRRAGGRKRSHDEPDWAKPVLLRMEERGIVESNSTGHFRIKPIKKKKEQDKRRVSPDIAKILKESGVDVEGVEEESGIGPDEYYDQL